MPDEEFTAEETAALGEMKADPGDPLPDATDAPADAPEATEEVAPVEPVAEVTAEPVIEPVVDKVADPAKPPPGFVPHGALHEERMKRQAAEAELQTMKDAAAAAKPIEVPDPILDPEGFKAFIAKQATDQIAKDKASEEQNRQQAIQFSRLQTAAQLEQTFAAQTPDYAPAVQYLQQHRITELRSYGYGDDQISEIVRNDANTIFDSATTQGKNPAQILYEMAKHRGYAKAAPVLVPVDTTAADQMKALEDARANAGTLSTVGGPTQSGGYTMAQLSTMSESELAKLPKDVVMKVMGG